MKRQEILIIFLLTLLVTGLSWFVTTPSEMPCLPVPTPFIKYYSGCAKFVLPKHMDRGYPIAYWKDAVDLRPHQISFLNFGVNFLFWFLVLTAGWWVIKKLRSKKK